MNLVPKRYIKALLPVQSLSLGRDNTKKHHSKETKASGKISDEPSTDRSACFCVHRLWFILKIYLKSWFFSDSELLFSHFLFYFYFFYSVSNKRTTWSRRSTVTLIKWFSTVQQFFEKIVKCLGPLEQSDTCRLLFDNPLSASLWRESSQKAWLCSVGTTVWFIHALLPPLCHFATLCYSHTCSFWELWREGRAIKIIRLQ